MDAERHPNSRAHIPASVANLRPVSSSPERASEAGKRWGIGSPGDTRKRCKRNGCRAIAHKATGYCTIHNPMDAGTAAAFQHVRDNPAPPDLRAQDAWKAASALNPRKGRFQRQAALIRAWDAAQNGDWGPWRAATS